VVLELHVRCSIAFGTSCLKVVVMGIIVLRLFGNFSLENFQLGFWLSYFEAQIF
jgi:hypothetical protein